MPGGLVGVVMTLAEWCPPVLAMLTELVVASLSLALARLTYGWRPSVTLAVDGLPPVGAAVVDSRRRRGCASSS